MEWRAGAGWRRCRRGGVCIACRRVCKRLRTFGCRSGLHLLRAAAVLAVVEAVVVLVAADATRILGRASADSGEVAVPRLGAVCAPEHRPEGGRGRSRLALLGSLTLLGAAAKTVEVVLRRRESSLKPAHVGFGKLEFHRVRQRRSEQ